MIYKKKTAHVSRHELHPFKIPQKAGGKKTPKTNNKIQLYLKKKKKKKGRCFPIDLSY